MVSPGSPIAARPAQNLYYLPGSLPIPASRSGRRRLSSRVPSQARPAGLGGLLPPGLLGWRQAGKSPQARPRRPGAHRTAAANCQHWARAAACFLRNRLRLYRLAAFRFTRDSDRQEKRHRSCQHSVGKRAKAGRSRSPPPLSLSLLLDALDSDGAEAGVFCANVRIKLLAFIGPCLDRVHIREL